MRLQGTAEEGVGCQASKGGVCFPIGWHVVVKETAVWGWAFLVRRGFRDAEALRQLTHRHLGRHLRAALSWEGSVGAGASWLPLLLSLVSGFSRRSGLHGVPSAAAGNAAGRSPEGRSPGPRTF